MQVTTRQNHFAKLLELQGSKTMKMSNLGYPPKRSIPGISWRNAGQAGLFTDLDVLQADRQLAKSKKNAELRQAKEDAPLVVRRNDDPTITTLRNAVFTRRP